LENIVKNIILVAILHFAWGPSMFDKKKIEEILIISKSEQWDYPKKFNALKNAGVAYYDVTIADRGITYYGNGQSFTEPVFAGFQNLEIAEKFDVEAFKKALHKHQVEKTPYEDFLKDTAKAGIHYYRVDMSKRTISYCGKKPGEEYIEKIPQI
jgi:uncharacterized protein YbcV (DUF1398 family)